jgi:hypothetical protein
MHALHQTTNPIIAAEVLESIEGIAQEEIRIKQSLGEQEHLRLYMFPAIVTNAELIACQFKSKDIKINDGTLDLSNLSMCPVPFIRFRKSLGYGFPDGRFYDLQSAQKARERTIFIVNARTISEFLTGWKVDPRKIDGYAIQRHLG